MTKTVKFTIVFDEPIREQVLTVACPFCKALVAASCVVKGYGLRKTHPTRTLHHERIAAYLNLEPAKVRGGGYRIK